MINLQAKAVMVPQVLATSHVDAALAMHDCGARTYTQARRTMPLRHEEGKVDSFFYGWRKHIAKARG